MLKKNLVFSLFRGCYFSHPCLYDKRITRGGDLENMAGVTEAARLRLARDATDAGNPLLPEHLRQPPESGGVLLAEQPRPDGSRVRPH